MTTPTQVVYDAPASFPRPSRTAGVHRQREVATAHDVALLAQARDVFTVRDLVARLERRMVLNMFDRAEELVTDFYEGLANLEISAEIEDGRVLPDLAVQVPDGELLPRHALDEIHRALENPPLARRVAEILHRHGVVTLSVQRTGERYQLSARGWEGAVLRSVVVDTFGEVLE